MPGHLTNPEIAQRLDAVATELAGYCATLDNELFFSQPDGKWSVAQQLKHLITATNAAKLAFILPKFIVRRVGGKPNRLSRTYEELVAKYQLKLEQGGRASGRYVPKPVPVSYGKEKLTRKFVAAMHGLAHALQKKWQEHQPDQYIVPHPLLGKITLRELCYFTIYHTLHHLHSIRAMTNNGDRPGQPNTF
jgi:uncharacterized damage-inducible protein DinB